VPRQHEYLQQLFKRVLIASEVAGEFTRLTEVQKRFSGLVLPNWIETSAAPKSLPIEVIEAQLDSGESAAIVLCLSQKADALLIDEKAGRGVEAQLGVRTVGILGILVDART
jgi:predicted nucleic acid-binding protein